MSKKLMTNGQGISFAQVGRAKKVPSEKVQEREKDLALVLEAIRDGRPITIGPMPTSVVYPDWVKERLTPELEVTTVCNPGKVDLYFDPRQKKSPYPTGHGVYEHHKEEGLLEGSLSLGHLKFFEENRGEIPDDWKERGLLVYGWASVVRSANGSLVVPCLSCDVDRSYVDWCSLGFRWNAFESSGRLAS